MNDNEIFAWMLRYIHENPDIVEKFLKHRCVTYESYAGPVTLVKYAFSDKMKERP